MRPLIKTPLKIQLKKAHKKPQHKAYRKIQHKIYRKILTLLKL